MKTHGPPLHLTHVYKTHHAWDQHFPYEGGWFRMTKVVCHCGDSRIYGDRYPEGKRPGKLRRYLR